MTKKIIILFSIFSVGILYLEAADIFSPRVFVTSASIIVFSIFKIFTRASQPYSLEKIFYIFSLFFFGIAPLLQFYNRSSFFGSRRLLEEEYFLMNLIILGILGIYSLSYYYFNKLALSGRIIRLSQKFLIQDRLGFRQKALLIGIAFFSFLMVFYANDFSWFSMLIRGGEFKESTVQSRTASLLIFRFFQPLSMVCLYYFITSKSKDHLVLVILSFLALLTCFPLAMARFSAAALYLPLMILIFPWFRKKNLFSLFFVLSLLIVFPFLNQFRHFDAENNLRIGFDFSMFIEGHFDSYQNFALIVNENFITYGRQLLGVFSFWIPRAIWPDKPIGSGALTAETFNFYFTNVSANFFAEGYINFGFLGIFLFALILAMFTAYIDKIYWKVLVEQKENFAKAIYLILLGMLFFMLRGDLMSSFAFTLGFIFSVLAVHRFVR